MKNEMKLQFSAVSQNESFARVAVASFIAQLDPTIDELTEIKTVVSEAVTNAIILVMKIILTVLCIFPAR